MIYQVYLLLSIILLVINAERGSWGKIEPEYSFRPPVSEYIQYWTIGGSAFIVNNAVNFRPSTQQKTGYLWGQRAIGISSWEMVFELSVSGKAPLETGEGLAFWIVADKNEKNDGSVYGHSDQFNGIGVFFDSFDSNLDGIGEPYVLLMSNNGKQTIDAEGGGIQLGVCFLNYRDLPFPAVVKVSYDEAKEGHFVVELDITNSGTFQSCISVKNVVLPPVPHFGFTVSSFGGNADLSTIYLVNTSPQASEHLTKTEEAILPVDDDLSKMSLSDNRHFTKMLSLLQDLDNQVFTVEDEFGKLFASVFHTHNQNIQHHISNNLQSGLNEKHVTVADHVSSLQATCNALRDSIGNLRFRIDTQKPSGNSESLSAIAGQVQETCVSDIGRGQTIVAQLKDSIATLRSRQDSVLSGVHSDLKELNKVVADRCSSGIFPYIIYTTIGFVVGLALTWLLSKNEDGRRLF